MQQVQPQRVHGVGHVVGQAQPNRCEIASARVTGAPSVRAGRIAAKPRRPAPPSAEPLRNRAESRAARPGAPLPPFDTALRMCVCVCAPAPPPPPRAFVSARARKCVCMRARGGIPAHLTSCAGSLPGRAGPALTLQALRRDL